MVTMKKPTFDRIVLDVYKKSKEYIDPDIMAYLHIKDESIPIPFIFYYEIKSDYSKALTDEIFIELFIDTSTYRDKIIPNMNNLKMSITYQVDYSKDLENKDSVYYIKTYNAIPTYVDKTLKESHRYFLDKNNLDATTITYLRFQLVDPILYKLKPLITSGIYRNTTVKDVIYGIFYKEFNNLNIGYKHFMVPPDNTRTYDHIIIKSRTKVIKLPHYLQTGDYGVYNGGIGTYIEQVHDNQYYLYNYPVVDYSKYNVGNRDRLIIYNPIKTAYGVNHISYAYDINKKCNNIVYKDYKLIATDVEILNKEDRKYIETYDTLYNVDPYVATDYMSEAVGNYSIEFDTSKLTKLYTAEANKSNVNNFLYTNMDDNLYKYKSLLIYNETVLAKVILYGVESTIFRPGMPVKYVYQKEDIAIELNGVLQSAHIIFNRTKKDNIIILYILLEKGE